MSLKSFHIFFIGCAILLAFGFGVWTFQSTPTTSGMMMAGIASTLIGIGLIVYGIRFLKKLKHVSFL